MGRLICATLIISTLVPSVAHTDTEQFPYYIMEAARAFELSPAMLYSLCMVESRCKAKAINKYDSTLPKVLDRALASTPPKRTYSPSYGLFQIKYATAKSVGYRGTRSGLLDPEINAFYAAKLFKQNLVKYRQHTKAISAHNAGKYISGNTQYVNKVLNYYSHYALDKGLK